MADLKTALHGAGLVSAEDLKKSEGRERVRAEMQAKLAQKPKDETNKPLSNLRECRDNQFRREARKLLLLDPSLIQRVLNIAHERGLQKKKECGGTRLIANLYQLREALEGKCADEAKSVVNKNFAKN